MNRENIGKHMRHLDRISEYVCGRYYRVVFKNDYLEKSISGLLINYAGGNIVLLSEEGIYHIKYKDIISMHPIKVFNFKEFNDDYREIIEESIALLNERK